MWDGPPLTRGIGGNPVQLLRSAQLSSEAVPIGVQGVVDQLPKLYEDYQYDKVLRLPGL